MKIEINVVIFYFLSAMSGIGLYSIVNFFFERFGKVYGIILSVVLFILVTCIFFGSAYLC